MTPITDEHYVVIKPGFSKGIRHVKGPTEQLRNSALDHTVNAGEVVLREPEKVRMMGLVWNTRLMRYLQDMKAPNREARNAIDKIRQDLKHAPEGRMELVIERE